MTGTIPGTGNKSTCERFGTSRFFLLGQEIMLEAVVEVVVVLIAVPLVLLESLPTPRHPVRLPGKVHLPARLLV